MPTLEVALDLPTELGADETPSYQCFSIYIPNKDSKGIEIGNQRAWVLEAATLLSKINGGATAMPPVEGGWVNDKEVIWEHPVVVYSWIKDGLSFKKALPSIREFLHRMGRETKQGEIAFEFGERFYRITKFDKPQKGK